MNMKRRHRIFGLVIAGLLLLSGCASSNKTPESTPPEIQEKTMILDEIGLRVEHLSPYDGIYIEKGDDENKDRVEGVYALAITNTAEKTIQKAHLIFSDGLQELNFYLEMLPSDSTVTVVEYDKKPVKSEDFQLVDSQITYLQDGLENMKSIKLVESEYGSATLRNTTNQKRSMVEVYYRRGYEGGTLGGKCYVEVLEDVEPGELLYLAPDYWTDKSKIVNVLIYPDLDTGN
jgi:hypothetical protein